MGGCIHSCVASESASSEENKPSSFEDGEWRAITIMVDRRMQRTAE